MLSLKLRTMSLLIVWVSDSFYQEFKLMMTLTRDWGAKSHKGDGIDTVPQVDEAAKMAGNVTNNSGTKSNGSDSHHKGGVALANSYKSWISNVTSLNVKLMGLVMMTQRWDLVSSYLHC